MSNIFLVRHAQSEANVNYNVLHHKTNMKVNLTNAGIQQAIETGHFFGNFLRKTDTLLKDIYLWNSPFNRTRQTASKIKEVLTNVYGQDVKQIESPYLIERNFGLVDADAHYFSRPENEAAKEYFKRHKSSDDEFFCMPPLGEAPFDMAMRMHQFYLHYINTPEMKEHIHIIVSHGASLRGLNLMVHHIPHEKYPGPNPLNASVSTMSPNGLQEIFSPNLKSS